MLRIVGAATLSGTLALGAIGASDTAGKGRTNVNRAPKADRPRLTKIQSTCPQSGKPYYESSCLRKNTRPGGNPMDLPVRIVRDDRFPIVMLASAIVN